MKFPCGENFAFEDREPHAWAASGVHRQIKCLAQPYTRPTVGECGLRGECPCCGTSPLFNGWLRVADSCPTCDTPLGQVRADDAPPYFTIFAVGHVIVPGMLWLEKAHAPDLWIHAAIWVPLTLALSLALMRPIKGATIGLMLKLGFGRPAGNA